MAGMLFAKRWLRRCSSARAATAGQLHAGMMQSGQSSDARRGVCGAGYDEQETSGAGETAVRVGSLSHFRRISLTGRLCSVQDVALLVAARKRYWNGLLHAAVGRHVGLLETCKLVMRARQWLIARRSAKRIETSMWPAQPLMKSEMWHLAQTDLMEAPQKVPRVVGGSPIHICRHHLLALDDSRIRRGSERSVRRAPEI
ncbi:hypothetical protein K491DRAFT_726042 [Lophiostoma macrostomum CBS 122681]|uniref:Uncharacterized protein n=1 Tax=Lophiostoma macrostomum CBS 122681 TaxID=1314788 RepID=A0A6A6T0G3_9PLEO|nr:hypothetical protein K491DRAFT_726042 [Lophiostoma macrostomum CBS 122681]